LKIQDSASRERVSTKALIEDDTMDGGGRAKQDARAENGCSIVEINNAGDDPLALDKGATIVFVLRLDLIS